MDQIQCRIRLPDWEARFADTYSRWNDMRSQAREQSRRRWMRYGTSDCAIFCADMVHAVWGEDKMARQRGGYRTRKQGLKQFAAGSLHEALSGLLRPIPLHLANRGDVIIYRNELAIGEDVSAESNKQGLAIKDHFFLLAPANGGIAFLNPAFAEAAFTLDVEVA